MLGGKEMLQIFGYSLAVVVVALMLGVLIGSAVARELSGVYKKK